MDNIPAMLSFAILAIIVFLEEWATAKCTLDNNSQQGHPYICNINAFIEEIIILSLIVGPSQTRKRLTAERRDQQVGN